jgi:hypothetical protein
MKKNYLLISIILAICILASIVLFSNYILSKNNAKNKNVSINSTQTITTFKDCLAAGYTIQETWPRRCITPQGKTYTEEIDEDQAIINNTINTDLIKITEPKANQAISSPVTIKGEARGTWFFEASFPARLVDSNGKILAQEPAQAKGEWMTEDFVPFEVTLSFSDPETTSGTLILQKDNPSGLPEYDDKIEIPVLFFSDSVGR